MNGDRDDLAVRSAVAFMWGTGGSIVRIFLQLGIQVALARLLGPAVYGVFAFGVLVVGLASYFADFGLAYGLIQKQNTTDDDVRFVWTWQCMLGVVIGALMFALAGPLAELFAKPETRPVFAWLSLVCMLNALTAPSTNLLKKTLDYRTLQVAQLAGYLAGYFCVGLPLALAGAEVSALIAAMVVQACVILVVQYARVRHPLGLRFWLPGGRAMLTYGATVLATNLVNWLLTSADKLMVGRLFPTHVIGVYSIAFNLVNAPAAAAYSNLQSVVFSAGARLQEDMQGLKSAFLRLLAAVIVGAFPLFALLAVGAGLAIDGIYGARWSEATPFLRIFAFAMPSLLIWGISTPVLWNTGRITLEVRMQVPMVLAWAAVLVAVASQPASVFALAAAVLLAARAAIMAVVAGRILAVTPGEAWRALSGGVAMTATMIGVTSYLLVPLASALQGPQLRLAVLLGSGASIYLLSIVLLGPLLLDRLLARAVTAMARRLPRRLARLVSIATREGVFTWPK